MCALVNAENYKPKHLLAIDSIQSRLDLAKSLGAEPWNFQTNRDGLDKRVKELTDGRGADVVIGKSSAISPKGMDRKLTNAVGSEVVGLSPALKMGFELLRPWGSSILIACCTTLKAHCDRCHIERWCAQCRGKPFSARWNWNSLLTSGRFPGTISWQAALCTFGSNQSIGRVTKRTVRISGFKWEDAPSDQFSLKRWICSSRSSIFSGMRIRPCHILE